MLKLFVVTAVLTLIVTTLAEDVPNPLILDMSLRSSNVTKWLEDPEVGLLAMKGTNVGPFCMLMPLPEIDQQLQYEDRETALRDSVLKYMKNKTFQLEPIYNIEKIAGEAIATFCEGRKTVLIEHASRRFRRTAQPQNQAFLPTYPSKTTYGQLTTYPPMTTYRPLTTYGQLTTYRPLTTYGPPTTSDRHADIKPCVPVYMNPTTCVCECQTQIGKWICDARCWLG